MRLIATMGATGIEKKHKYSVHGKVYESELSFLALAEAYNITDIIIIGTEQSQKSIQVILDNKPNIKMVVIESNSVEDVFQKSLEYIAKDTILDLTQGYRHYPMLTLLASIFLQSNASKNIKDIFYAQIIDENCHPRENSCPYLMTSLIKYLDIANMARIINTFNKTLLTLDYDVHLNEFKRLRENLTELTQELFSNNFKRSRKCAEDIEKNIDKILQNKNLDVIKNHLNNLKKELQVIQKLTAKSESETLLNVSEYLLRKDILLHSITLVYESMVAFLDEKIIMQKCNTYKGKVANTYQRRNCLKLNMGDCSNHLYKENILDCEKFSKTLRKIDRFRNNSAHAHTTGTYHEDLKEVIEDAIDFLKPIIKQNISTKDKLSHLENIFNNR